MAYYGQQRRDYQNRLRAEWKTNVNNILGGKCAICGATEDLEIHHRDPNQKSFYISRIWTRRWEIQIEEINKCELRCREHHKDFHAAKHGSHAKYKDHGCRCDMCVAFFRKYQKERMAAYRAAGKDKSRKNYNPSLAQRSEQSADNG